MLKAKQMFLPLPHCTQGEDACFSQSWRNRNSYDHWNPARDKCHQLSMFQMNHNFITRIMIPWTDVSTFNHFLTWPSSTVVILHSSHVQPKSHHRETPSQSFPPPPPTFSDKFGLRNIKIHRVRFIASRPGSDNLKQLNKQPAVSQHSSGVLPDAEKSLWWGYLGLSHQSS